MPEGGRVLLVIDQFEELFTITDEAARRRFLDAIARAVSEPDTQITVLLALRADYYDRPLLHPEFAKVFTPGVDERAADDGRTSSRRSSSARPSEAASPSSRRCWPSWSPMPPTGRGRCRCSSSPSPSSSTSGRRPR